MKDIFNIDFNSESLKEYKDEINEINNICKKLDNDRSFQRKYRKYLKSQRKLETKKNIPINMKSYEMIGTNQSEIKLNKKENNSYEFYLGGTIS